ncbi:extracellular solute-binding protein [Leadbettera azotonutricia]|uniref:Putative lipoprotein n=1 Tax=Leadbettera azotonutricia (strain ATCC BAA-888 / DSM 13862 / ZAS-9) TaxID=545695 RepID=F5YFJ0_LEAAZ|nr:extracellular solute-binding protein [Leadbettera azotonutricia]AEF81490.1 putative lipoprotein [Leadbettera azotonutricia ZAS-9]
MKPKVKSLSLSGAFALFIIFLPVLILSCATPDRPSPKNPVTLTVWHTMVEQMKTNMDSMVEEFNCGAGAKEGITVQVSSVANTAFLHEKLISAAAGDPGAPSLPDMAVIYPNVAIILAEQGLLMDFKTHFTGTELSRFVPEFLEEGFLGGDTLYALPIAKSTEVLYVNTVIFDRFAKAARVSLSQLDTIEGILDTAEKYYAWTDILTPDIPHDGKTFFYPDPLFNYFMIGFEQLGSAFIDSENKGLNSEGSPLESKIFRRIWESYYKGAVRGRIAIFNNYGNYLAKTGDIVCTASTSAGAVFYPDSVTYADNTKENAQWAVLPYPVFSGAEKVAMQRGGGMCVIKSTPVKEYAAAFFLKWFTDAERNARFTATTGYMPVQTGAYSARAMGTDTAAYGQGNSVLDKMFAAVSLMENSYRYYIPPVFEGFDSLQRRFIADIQKAASASREEYLGLIKTMNEEDAYNKISQGAFENFILKGNYFAPGN